MTSRIYSIDSIELSLVQAKETSLVVNATGRAQSSGWTQPALVPFVYVVPPADGILDCDFVANPPDGISLPVLTPISADLVLMDIDLENYWGPGLPLVGVRCHGVANSKTSMVAETREGMPPMRHLLVQPPRPAEAPSFARDIRPLFRAQDVSIMKIISNFDLHDYADVSEHADIILARIEDLTMPCDGPWPQTDIDLFRAWIDAGKHE